MSHALAGRLACLEVPGPSVVIAVLHGCLTRSRSLGSCSPDPFQRSRDVSLREYAFLIFLFPVSGLCSFPMAPYSLSLVPLTLTFQQWGMTHGHVFLKVNLSQEKLNTVTFQLGNSH